MNTASDTPHLNTIVKSLSTHQEQEIALALCITMNANVILWGPPGAGKTTVLKSIANRHNFHLETVLVSTKQASDIAGIPRVTEEGIVKMSMPDYVEGVFRASKEKKASIIFWDEFSTGLPSVQAASLTTILDKKAGPYQMPMGTRMVAAANPPRIAANGWELSAPTCNRFVHLDWTLDAATIADGFQMGWKAPLLPLLPRQQEHIHKAIRDAKMLIGSFLRAKPQMGEFDYASFRRNASKDHYIAAENAFPTARSWEVAATLYAACRVAQLPNGNPIPDNVMHILLAGTVGTSAAREFITYAKALDLPDPRELINHPESFSIPARNDQLSAVLSSVQNEALLQMNNFEDKSNIIWSKWGDVVCRIIDQGKGDIALPFAQVWQSAIPKNGAYTASHQASMVKLAKVFQ